ncbi:MAG: hypothetical protein GXY44_04465 [Phycisphaerales bacterium]|nr:hypothetical protein [Phycisphaerales bacterium]
MFRKNRSGELGSYCYGENRIMQVELLTRKQIRVRTGWVLLVCVWFSASTLGADYLLFTEGDPQKDLSNLGERSIPEVVWSGKRWREVRLAPVLGDPEMLSKDDTITLNLFEDSVYTAAIDSLTVNVNGTVTVRARLENYPLGYVLISTTDNRSLGSIRIPEQGQHYLIESGLDGSNHYLVEADRATMDELESAPPVIPPQTTKEEADLLFGLQDTVVGDPLETANIDVMIVYTPAALQWVGGGSGMANIIAQAMAKAHLALDNSATITTMTIVHSAEVDYVESGNSSVDLNRLHATNDGHMDVVHTWRNQYSADLVALFTKVDDTGGISYLLSSSSGQPSYAFSITRVQQASWSYTLIHELGHNLGCHHHKLQSVQPGPGLFSYSAGWRWTGDNMNKYCSIMTYEAGQYFVDGVRHTRVAHFSNPSINHYGVATGHAADGDNARTIREIKHVVAAYRNVVLPVAPPSPTASTNYCGDKTLTRAGSPPAGVTWYWQGTVCGTQTALGSGATFTAAASGTYYIRAQDNTSAQWSAGCGAVSVTVVQPLEEGPDLNRDCYVDQSDFALFRDCLSGQGIPHDGSDICHQADFDGDSDVDLEDYGVLQRCYRGPEIPADPDCQ